MLTTLWLACATPQNPVVEIHPSGVHLTSEVGVSTVEIRSLGQRLIGSQTYPTPLNDIALEVFWPESGAYILEASGPEQSWQIPLQVELNPLGFELSGGVAGQTQHTIADREDIGLAVVGGGTVQWTLTVQAWRDTQIDIHTEKGVMTRQLSSGESWMTWHPVSLGKDRVFRVCSEDGCHHFEIQPTPLPIEDAKAQLSVDRWTFPADAQGGEDIVLPESQLWLPAEWWQKALSVLSLGFRARDPWAPISFEGVTLTNHGQTPISVLVDSRVVDGDGAPAELFKPRVREGSSPDGRSRALLSVPPQKQARAVLPIYFDGPRFEGDQREWTMELRVSALGHATPLHTQTKTLLVQRAQAWVSIGFSISMLAGLSGLVMLLWRMPHWLNRSSSILSSIAMFAALETVARLVIRVAGLGAAAVLGPFSVFLTALPDQLIRFSIMGALIGLLPKKGVAALMVMVGWLLNGVLSGSLSAVGVVSLLGEIFWLETMLWAFGITRGQSGAARFFLAMVSFSVLSSACGYALHMVLYRLFYHPLYLLTVLSGPGCIYVALAALVSMQLTLSLKRVQR
ncbi:MAG: hypothetical protein VXZ96_19675 [Myxococcota bacterium]|nr:hypothetical protein [Myxococcota bacterium]